MLGLGIIRLELIGPDWFALLYEASSFGWLFNGAKTDNRIARAIQIAVHRLMPSERLALTMAEASW